MSVSIIDTLKPKNGLNFPVADAADIAVSNELRLDTALDAKAEASALEETNAAVASKANATDVAAATSNLQGQIDQIEVTATAEGIVAPEVAGARIGADSTSYTTLKERLDSEKNQSDSEFLAVKTDLTDTQKVVGGTYRLYYEEVSTMIGTDGSQKSETSTIKFYKVSDLKGSKKITITVEASGSDFTTHWFNQIDSFGNVISYVPISIGASATEVSVTLLGNTASIVVSMNIANGEFVISADVSGTISAEIEENANNIENLQYSIYGGEKVFTPETTNSMYNGSGEPKTPPSGTHFYLVDNLSGGEKIQINYTNSGQFNTHWWNEYDENGNLIYYVTLNSTKSTKSLEVTLRSETKSIKFLMWNDMGAFSCVNSVDRDVVQLSDVSDGYNKLSALGDSITAGKWYDDGTWKTLQNTYHRLISEKIGVPFQNLGVSSTPICPNSNYTDGQNDDAFVYRYSQIAEDADIIVVAGGTNDFRHLVPLGTAADTAENYESTFYGAVDYLINNIMLEHPTARLIFVTPFHQIDDTSSKTTLDGETVYLSDYITALKEKCKQYGVLCIDGLSESGISLRSDFVSRFMPDSLHPNEGGHEIIYKNLMHYFATL